MILSALLFIFLPILFSCPLFRPVWYLGQYLLLFLLAFILVLAFGGLSYFSLNLVYFQFNIFAFCIGFVTFILDCIQPTTQINIKGMIVVIEINRIVYIVSILIIHVMRWALAMMRFMMQIMILSHFHRLPYGSHH